MAPRHSRFPFDPARDAIAAAILSLGLSGCAMFSGSDLPSESVAQNDLERAAYESVETDDVQGPLQRMLTRSKKEPWRDTNFTRRMMTLGRAEFEEGEKLYKGGDYAGASKILKTLVTKDRYENAFVREDALYLYAESKFQQEKYPIADDAFMQLFKEFPNTRYTQQSTKRLFEIATIWLQIPKEEIAKFGELQQVNFEQPDQTAPPVDDRDLPFTSQWAAIPNFADGSRPLFDTQGRAINSLRSIWLNDPTGPLADDALMLTASYYYRVGRNEEADRYFQILRDEYPKSPYARQAFVLGGRVRLMSYQGAAYDGTPVEEAEKIYQSTLALYPNTPEAERLREEQKRFKDLKAARLWEKLELYQRKGKPKAVAIYAAMILQKHSDSKYAPGAQRILAQSPPDALAVVGLSPGQITMPDATGSPSRVAANPQPNPPPPANDSAGTASLIDQLGRPAPNSFDASPFDESSQP